MKLKVALLTLAAVATGQVPNAAQGVALSVAVPASARSLVSVQAVMLPYAINRELFSKHIADNYAVVVVNVGNHSHDAALVMQGLYLDYSKWALSGSVASSGSLGTWPGQVAPGQVSSVEYRIVRGELEERDAKSVRNWIVRTLEFAGSIAGGTTFAYGAISNIPRYISMANGVGIPGFQKLWPDPLITRLNRISDFGYRVNRVVPRESSDVMIAFFPIDRFLTPKLKTLFIRQPALFFNTGLALMDPNPQMTAILERVSGQTLAQLTAQIPAMMACASATERTQESNKAACDRSATLREMVKSTSLNSIEVVIDGNLMLDLAAVPPSVDALTFQDQAERAAYWSVAGAEKGIVVLGRFLDGARVLIEPASAGIEWVGSDLASSERLSGKLRFTKPVQAGQQLSIKVVKDTKEGQSMLSAPVLYTVEYLPTPIEDHKVH